ncbi:MAG TPA: hypothetical protein VKF60_08625 [Myxococcota bacterium]|nr:hypothetical protein [Myxococcota bacterium]
MALLALGCAASATLHARPESVCAGRAVRLTWDGSGSGELSAEPADPSLGEVAASGSKSVRPKATTTYRFRVGSLVSSATSSTIVKVVSLPELPAPIRGSVSDEGSGCAPGRIWVTARVPAGAWDARLRVNLVASADGRAYRVEHAARSAELGVDTPSDAFRDLPVAGAWRLETALRPGEVCAGASAPESLALHVSFVCAE